MTSKTVSISQESAANALALNKDNSQVVIAGRTDHILATAATNGAVVLWNLNRTSRSKQDHVFMDHKRTVNKVSFHITDPALLISGSQDGTMKCFDLRLKEATKTFYSNTESVRDVQFSPHQPYTFAAVSENGSFQQWDLRKPDRYFQNVSAAHSGPIFACDWHPENPWLATASRDKTIKVWELSLKPKCEYMVQTIASVGRIKWRPQRKFQIASSALVVDSSIHVWDLRRPHIPFASFNEHKDVTTGLSWHGDSQCFLSTSRDCTLIHHAFKDATRPASKANPQGVALNTAGDIAYARKVNTNAPSAMKQITNMMRKTSPSNEAFCSASSTLQQFRKLPPKEQTCFKNCAQGYIFNGKLSDVCDHNAAVAASSGRNDLKHVWEMIKSLYANPVEDIMIPTVVKDDTNVLNLGQSVNHAVDHPTTGNENEVKSVQGETVSVGDDETETDETPDVSTFIGPKPTFDKMYQRPSMLNKRKFKGDFTFGENEFDFEDLELGNSGYVMDNIEEFDWNLPHEAFDLRHEIQDRSPPPEQQFPNYSPEMKDDAPSAAVENQLSQLVVTCVPKPKPWIPTDVVVEMLKFHAEMRDIQTTIAVLFAIGDRRKSLKLEMALQEHWLMEYIDMLGRYKLWDVATRVIQSSWISSVSQLNQQSTTIHVCCTLCSKRLQHPAWLCDRCKSSRHALCSICHQVVKGLYVWCQGCAHGGHMLHLKEWFSSNRQCPTGCGHACEFT